MHLSQHTLAITAIILFTPSYTSATSPRKFKWWKHVGRNETEKAGDKTLELRFDRLPYSRESFYTTSQVISSRGYPAEIHHVTTDDGYILELHRIPAKTSGKRPILLQHGVYESSGTWVVNPASRSLACLLSDLGYDVWMSNSRGNRYSRRHVRLDPKGAEFWDFAWDEMGKYDIPATINYILAQSGRDKLIYCGQSMGGAIFFIAMITYPELNDKIEMMFGLAPLSSFAHYKGILRFFAPFVNPMQAFLNLIGTREFVDNEGFLRFLLRLTCDQTYLKARICRRFLNDLVGQNINNIELDLIPSISSNIMMGTSVKTIAQFAQNYNAGEVFQAYDFGRNGNLQRYGTTKPLVYDLKKVTAPTYIYYGSNDDVVAPEDVEWLIRQLGNVKYAKRIEGYNHADFLWGTDVKERLYDSIIAVLPPP